MYKKKFVPQQIKEQEIEDIFTINFDIINKRIDKIAETISAAGKDGNINHIELNQIILELRILETLLKDFLDEQAKDKIKKSREKFKEKYDGIKPDSKQFANIQKVYTEHILQYFEELVRAAFKAAQLGSGNNGETN